MKTNTNRNSKLQSQSPRGLPIKHVTMTSKRTTDKFQPYPQYSPRGNTVMNSKRGGGGSGAQTSGASIQQLRRGPPLEDEVIEEAYQNGKQQYSNMPRVNTLAKVRVKPKNTDSYAHETSANQSTSYGGWPSPRQTSGKRTVSLQQHLNRDVQTRIKSSNRRDDSLRMKTSLQKPAFRSLNKGSRNMNNTAVQNSNIFLQHVQVPLHIFASNEGPHIAGKKSFKEDGDNKVFQSNQNIYQQTQPLHSNNNQDILDKNNLISQDISLNTLPHYADSRNDSVQQNLNMPDLQQQLFTHQTSGTNVQIEGDDRNGPLYMMAPPISQMNTQQSLLPNQHNAPTGQLQASMSWNMQTQSPVALADLKKKQALQDKLSKHIGSQTFAQKQVHENSGVQFGSNENIDKATLDDERDSYFLNSQLNQQFNATGKSIFDNTPIQDMPSIKPSSKLGSTIIPRIDTQQINSYTDQPILPPQINQAQGVGFVNYVNGVPVSIQLSKNDLMSTSALGKFPQTSVNRNVSQNSKLTPGNLRVHVKSDLDKKIQAFNNQLYIQKQINQNLVEVQAKQGQYLPIIDTTGMVQAKPFMPTNVRPDFFRTKRKMQNLTVLRGIYDDGFQGFKQSQVLDQDTFPMQNNPLRNSMEQPDNDVFSGLNYQGNGGSFSLKRSLKKRKGFPPKESFSNKKHLKQHLEEFADGKNKKTGDKFNTNNPINTKSPIIESARSRASSKPPTTNIDSKDIPKKLQTAMAGSRAQHYTTAAVTKAIGTSQALKRNHHSIRKLKNKTQIDDADKNKITNNTNVDIYGVSIDLQNTSAYRPSDIGATNQKSAISKYDGGAKDNRTRSPIRVQGQSPVPGEVPNVYPFNYSETFQKVPIDPSLFKIKVPRLDMEHLMRDDLDEMSKMEVIYKIFKNQLRQHQKTLIKLREEETKRKKKAKEEAGITGRSNSNGRDTVDIREFARYIKPFELHGPQRDLSPELRRIVKNLTCQEHSYVYCPHCKKYEETEHDPLTNIRKFIKQIKDEQKRLNQEDPFKPPVKKKPKKKKSKPLPDDSVSDITDLEEDEILAKYFKKNASKIRKEKKEQAKQRHSAQQRLLGEQVTNRHSCKDHRLLTEEEKQRMALDDTVVLELRKPEQRVHMHDEDQSAHQFSVREQSIQADSEERLDIEMQASKVIEEELRSSRRGSMAEPPSRGSPGRVGGVRNSFEMFSPSRKERRNTEKKSNFLGQTQFSSSPVRSINLSPVKSIALKPDGKLKDKDTLFKQTSQKSNAGMQTDPHYLLSNRPDQNSLEEIDENDRYKYLDKYKDDWAESVVYKKAMKTEATKRGLPTQEYEIADDEEDTLELHRSLEPTDSGDLMNRDHSKSTHEIGFMKSFKEKGNIQMLKETEVGYLKTLLKTETEQWEYNANLDDIYRHCKFTIRMLTRRLARIDNRNVFGKNKDINKQSTLTMIYRAEVLYSAKDDAYKIFQNMSKYIFDYGEFERIQQLDKVEDPKEYKFIKQREFLIRRLMSQITNFLSQYKIFDDSFIFKSINIHDYLSSELEKVSAVRQYIDGQNNASFLGVSKKVNEEKKTIVQIKKAEGKKKKKSGTAKADKSPRIQIDVGNSDNESQQGDRVNNKKGNDQPLKSGRSKKSRTPHNVSGTKNGNKNVENNNNQTSSLILDNRSPKLTTMMSLEMNKTID